VRIPVTDRASHSPLDSDIGETMLGEGESVSRPRARPQGHLDRGATVSRYVVLEEVGRGAMGVVYVAIDPELERRVAVKVLHRGQTRLLKEARALARLSHENVVGVFDVGEADGRLFVAMEYVDGLSLDKWLETRTRSWAEIVDVFIAAGRGLVAAHTAGLIHRDFKPANVMVADDGRVKVTDFGLARATDTVDPDELLSSASSSLVGATDLTATRGRLGTPAYMAPELHRELPATPQTDQFAFCVALHRCLFGEYPFDGEDVASTVAAIVANRQRPIPEGPVPSLVRRAIARGLRHEPQARFGAMADLVAQLQRSRTPSRRPLWILGGAVAVGVGAWLAWRPTPPDPCADVTAEIDDAWSDARADALRDAFAKSALPFAARASDEAVSRIDDYVQTWKTLRADACRAGQSPDVSAARTATLQQQCLARARSDVQAVADVLVAGDDAAVTHATELVYGLPRLDDCTDPRLASALPVPDDAQTAEAVARVRARLAQARAQRVADLGAVGDAELEDLAAQAEALGFVPLSAEVALERAYAQLRVDPDDGARRLDFALQTAIEGDADLVAAQAVASLLRLDGDGRGRDGRAQAWEQLARGYARRWPDRGRLQVELKTALAVVLSHQGRFDEAVQLAHDAAQQAEALEDPWQASVRQGNYGLVLTRAGRLDDALAVLTEHVDNTVALYGAEHPESAWAYNALGNVHLQLQRFDDALQWCERAVDTYARLPDMALEHSHALNNVANALAGLGETARARDSTQRAVQALREHTKADHPTMATLLNNLGSYANQLGEPAEAAARFEDALQMHQRMGDPALQTLLPVANLARAHYELDQPDDARRMLARTVALLRDEVPEAYPLAGQVWLLVGTTYLDLGDRDEAAQAAATAHRLLAAQLGEDAELTAQAADVLERARPTPR
jgi:serine/threonine-protein kinase